MIYLKTLEKFNIVPNFWCSEEYWEKAEWCEYSFFDLITVKDKEGNPMLPTINIKTGTIDPSYESQYSFPFQDFGFFEWKFLDYQFIYDPIEDMNNLPGNKWKTTRKNIHKISREAEKTGYCFYEPTPPIKECEKLLEIWTCNNNVEDYFDPEILIKFVLFGNNRIFLRYKDALQAILTFDENYKYINFRYCIVNNFPGLSDYTRILFRQMMSYKNKQINDGGCLGRPGLEKYKRRLNPAKIQTIKTGIIK